MSNYHINRALRRLARLIVAAAKAVHRYTRRHFVVRARRALRRLVRRAGLTREAIAAIIRADVRDMVGQGGAP